MPRKEIYRISQMLLSGEEGKKIDEIFHRIAEEEFKGNATKCFSALVMEANEKREKTLRPNSSN
jgi:hypothetical protein